MSRTSTYYSWHNLRVRCSWKRSNSYKDYGAKGIRVCERWNIFKNFLEDMGEKPKGYCIERIDNSKGYFKENCCWITRRQSARHRNSVKLSKIKAAEIIKKHRRGISTKELAKEYEVTVRTIYYVLERKTWAS